MDFSFGGWGRGVKRICDTFEIMAERNSVFTLYDGNSAMETQSLVYPLNVLNTICLHGS